MVMLWSLAVPDTAPAKVRIGVVGGLAGAEFQWHEHPDCTVVAVSDLLAERRKKLMQTYRCVRDYPTLQELVKDKSVDAVALFTGAPSRTQQAADIMLQGKHVIVNWPACLKLDDAQLLEETARKTGQTYMMAEPSYYLDFVISAPVLRRWPIRRSLRGRRRIRHAACRCAG